MPHSSSWWRRLGAALSALVLAVLVLGPSLDAIICHDDLSMSAAAAEALTERAAPHQDRSDHGGDGLACVHGHCHHGSAYAPVAFAAVEGREALRAEHKLFRVRVEISDPKFGLKRPPRA